MKRVAVFLLVPAAVLVAATSLIAQDTSRADGGRRYELIKGGSPRSLVVLDTSTGTVYTFEDDTHGVLDPVQGVCRLESTRWPQRDALAKKVAAAILAGDPTAVLPFLSRKEQSRLRANPGAMAKFARKLDAVRVDLGKDVDRATRMLLEHEASDLKFSEAEGRWYLAW